MKSARCNGFTLIEAMVVLAILALTLTLGVPSFAGVIERQHVSTAMHLLSTDLAMARGSAVMKGSQVVVCPGDAQRGCRDDSDWSGGWIVFNDGDQDRQPNAPGDLLRVEQPLAGSATTLQVASSRPYLRYQADGRSANSNLTVRLCASGLLKGSVIVNNTGRVRTERPAREVDCATG